ncbi:MAG: c-type cytochrome [Thermomonas sp.]
MRLSTFAAFLALALPAGAFAQDAATPASSTVPAASTPAAAAPAALVGDAARGKPLTYTCQGCHGVVGYKNAYPNYHVPKIGGQSAQFLTNALMEYRTGKRKHPTMQAQAQSFSEQDIADIAAYLSGIDK